MAPVRRTTPFPTWPVFEADEVAAAVRVLESGKVNYWRGEEVREFECSFAGYTGVPYAIALSNGTIALEAALRAAGIGPGDEVVVPPRTYVATASSVAFLGARPVFADVDPDSEAITAETIERVLSPKTKAIIVVHLHGWPADMDPIMALAESRNLLVIEDCAQAHGASYKGKPVGGFGDIGAWSFCQDKIMTTAGEGGMVTTRSGELWSAMWSFKDHGKSHDTVSRTDHPPGFRWLVESFGTNARMTEVQGAIGRLQLEKLPAWSAQRRANAQVLTDGLADHPLLRVPTVPATIEHARYKYSLFIRLERLRTDWSRDRIMQEVTGLGIPCFSGICGEVYLEKAFREAGMTPRTRLPIARQLAETSLQLLVHPTLGSTDMDDAVSILRYVADQACRR
ncbi:MAG: DegT/DnrJ/EryC1/StrS aminotransferase family protein [Bacteroidota bacterium]